MSSNAQKAAQKRWTEKNPEKVRAYAREWRKHNRERVREMDQRRRERINQLVRDARDKPCVDCGIKLPPEVMHFDHVKGTKLFGIGTWSKSVRCAPGKTQEQMIFEEIAKCEIRCPNCHGMRHYLADLD